MAGKFINIERKATLDSVIEGYKQRMNNPYYMNMDKKMSPTTYYNQNTTMSTLDSASQTAYSLIGKDSPLRFNKIEGLYILGLERLEVQLQNEDWGVEADDIEGEAIILPNTIIPIPNDYFTVDHVDEKVLFKVISVSPDTLESGANFYKISYKMDRVGVQNIEPKVVSNYKMIAENIGTNFNSIIKNTDYDYIESMQSIIGELKNYFIGLFYSTRVQTFIFNINHDIFYDPYMIEFIIKNDLLNGSENYIFVTHQTHKDFTFVLNYDKTLFRAIETKRIPKDLITQSVGKFIDEPLSIFANRKEDYFKIAYDVEYVNDAIPIINNFDAEFIEKIKSKTHYSIYNYRDIFIKYFNNEKISSEDIDIIEEIKYDNSMRLFYDIPILIFCLESMIKDILKTQIKQ